MEKFMHALQFAAYKHRFQKRKDVDGTPYINHPIGVATILSNEAGIKDFDLLSVGDFFNMNIFGDENYLSGCSFA
jgi:(p)ppGpp synthase/HD superfamily hydrolase